jgi:hypothetical protein
VEGSPLLVSLESLAPPVVVLVGATLVGSLVVDDVDSLVVLVSSSSLLVLGGLVPLAVGSTDVAGSVSVAASVAPAPA